MLHIKLHIPRTSPHIHISAASPLSICLYPPHFTLRTSQPSMFFTLHFPSSKTFPPPTNPISLHYLHGQLVFILLTLHVISLSLFSFFLIVTRVRPFLLVFHQPFLLFSSPLPPPIGLLLRLDVDHR